MTQAGPLTLTPSSSLAPASGWLAQIGTFVLLAVVGLLVLPPLLYLAAAALKAGELGAVTIGSLVGLAAMTLSLATLATIWAMLLALPLAWLVIRTDLPFRNLCRWMAVIPLAIPSYIGDRKSTRLNSSHGYISYAVFCLKKKKTLSNLRPRAHLAKLAATPAGGSRPSHQAVPAPRLRARCRAPVTAHRAVSVRVAHSPVE